MFKTILFAIGSVAALGVLSLSATSVRLKNDTKNVMMVEIHASDGTLLGEEKIQPLSTDVWYYESSLQGKPRAQKAITPLTVIWKTKEGDFFSSCNQVISAETVTPLQCKAGQ